MESESHQQQQIVFGSPLEWNHFKARHPVFLDRLPNLYAACTAAYERTAHTSEPLDRVIYFSGRLCLEEFNEILLLCGNGYGVAALRLVRGMYERTVTARYLRDHPEETDNFFEFYWVSQHRLMKAIETTMGAGLLGEKKTDEVEENYRRVKDRFMVTDCKECGTNRLNYTWSKLDFVSMTRAAGEIGKLIVPAYYLPTKEAHSTVGAILSRLDKGATGFIFDGGPQRKRADDALISAHNVILNSLFLQEEYFKLGFLAEALQGCISDFLEIWGPNQSAVSNV